VFHDREVEPPPYRRNGEEAEPERRRSGATRLAMDRHDETESGKEALFLF
jgi:hypothetical protein